MEGDESGFEVVVAAVARGLALEEADFVVRPLSRLVERAMIPFSQLTRCPRSVWLAAGEFFATRKRSSCPPLRYARDSRNETPSRLADRR